LCAIGLNHDYYKASLKNARRNRHADSPIFAGRADTGRGQDGPRLDFARQGKGVTAAQPTGTATEAEEREAMKAEDVLVKVGEGRGVVVRANGLAHPLIITCAHCIPERPSAHLARYLHEYTFRLLGPLFGRVTVFAEVLFYDPIADVAVLSQPDAQVLFEQADAFDELLAHCKPIAVAANSPPNGAGFVFDLKGKLQPVTYEVHPSGITVRVEGYPFLGGMSGSPILDDQHRVVALCSVGDLGGSDNFPSPRLAVAIPSRVPVQIKRRAKK
jgi:hypothetical protein